MEPDLSAEDRRQLRERGIEESTLRAQLDQIRRGTVRTELVRACTAGDGIRQLTRNQRESAREAHRKAAARGRFIKFVPASGAASRMFKPLLTVLRTVDHETGIDELRRSAGSGDEDARFAVTFLENVRRFPFAPALAELLARRGTTLDAEPDAGRVRNVLAAVLEPDGLAFASLPKGLIPFHRAGDDVRTPVTEHMFEASDYVRGADGRAPLHFTVSPQHRARFDDRVRRDARRFPHTEFAVSFSEQAASTDTIAADLDNRPLRDRDGRLVFRPGGHGALLPNLNALDADFVYIKNVDNVVPPDRAELTLVTMRELAGVLAQLVERRNEALEELASPPADAFLIERWKKWVSETLELEVNLPQPGGAETRRQALFDELNRPVRVCGMVRNVGQPGGGPFWVRRSSGRIDRQIVEMSQIELGDPGQAEIVADATHFNPVEIVCALRDHRGKPYDLRRYVDPETAFIARKSKDGRELKALELPGLWNGSMADWLTVFVEVPEQTFNPVKTVNDLLGEAHRPL